MKTKVLVLGSTGMLGSMVFGYLLKDKNLDVNGTKRKIGKLDTKKLIEFDAENFIEDEKNFNFLKEFDYIINCIGIIKPYCQDNDPDGVYRAIKGNALFPHKLARFLKNSKTKIIQIATDCVYSGNEGNYDEDSKHDALDVYGKTKSLGEVDQKNFLNIRCSIIGPEEDNKVSLLEWYLKQPENSELQGFSHHKWNGVTTLQFAELCRSIINDNSFNSLRNINKTLHYVVNETVNKFELLGIFDKAFRKKHNIKNVDNVGPTVDRTLSSKFTALNPKSILSMQEALDKLVAYMKDNKLSIYA